MKLIILSDDRSRDKRFIAKHSFSLFLKVDYDNYLVGLGIDPDTLEHNSWEKGIDLGVVDKAIVTHEHTAHFGGYKYLANEAPFTEVYIPFGSSESLGRLLMRNGLRPIEVMKTLRIDEKVYISSPYYGPPYEHFVLINDEKGLIIITGCLHPGLDPVLELRERFNKEIRGLIGGFHLYNSPDYVVDQYINVIIDKINPEFIIPLHCSGNRFLQRLREINRLNVIELTTGDTIDL